MNLRNFLVSGLIAGIAFTSCSKGEQAPIDEKDPFVTEFSELNSEENKANLEDAGIDMLEEFDEMQSSEAMDIMENFSEIFEDIMAEDPMPAIIGLMAKGQFTSEELTNSLKATAEEPNSFTELWSEVEGKYIWNSTTESWDEEVLTGAIVFEFPGIEGEVENTATLTVNNFSAQAISDPGFEIDPDIDAELPTSLHVDLAYKGTTLSTFDFSGSYLNDGMPTSVNSTFTIETFSMNVTIAHTPYSELAYTYTFKHGDKVLVSAHLDATGNWAVENIEDNIVEHEEFMYYDSWSGDSIYDYWTEPIIENIVYNGNAYIQVLTIKVAGQVNIKDLAPAIKKLEEQEETLGSEEYNKQLADLINENALFVVVYSEDNSKIAAAEAYAYNDVEYDDWYIDFRFVFADGSKVDAETYFDEGFDEFFEELENLIDKFEQEYDEPGV